jgi:hypothetical protein
MASDRPGVFFLPFSCYAAENTFSFIVQYHTAFLIFSWAHWDGQGYGEGSLGFFLYVRVLQQKAVTLVVKAQNKILKIFWNSGNAALEENPNLHSRYAL